MANPRFAFFGTPELSVYVLDTLEAHGYTPALVITAPDKPRGRKLELTPSPAKQWAQERNIEIMQPATLKDEGFQAELGNTDWDLFIVAAYTKLIPKTMLDMPRHGALNVHPSLLPKFRGPSPVLSAILANERQTGVTIMQMGEEMDAGPIIAQARIEIAEEEWPLKGSELSEMLFSEGGNLLAEILPDWMSGKIEAAAQEGTLATFTKKFSDEDSRIDVAHAMEGHGALDALLKIRAFDQNPRAYCVAHKNGKTMRVIITEAHLEGESLVIDRVIPEGKKEMAFEEFKRSGAEF